MVSFGLLDDLNLIERFTAPKRIVHADRVHLAHLMQQEHIRARHKRHLAERAIEHLIQSLNIARCEFGACIRIGQTSVIRDVLQ